MPGHASAAIASYPWLGTTGKQIKVPCNFGVHYNAYNVADPRVIQFQEDVLEEVIALFPSPVIHIGGDELRYNAWKESDVYKRQKYAIATQKAVAVDYSQGDSLFMHADTLQMYTFNLNTDSTFRETRAYHKVRMYRTDVQGVCAVSYTHLIYYREESICR